MTSPSHSGSSLLAKVLDVILPPGLRNAIREDFTVALFVPLIWAFLPVVWLLEVIKGRPKN